MVPPERRYLVATLPKDSFWRKVLQVGGDAVPRSGKGEVAVDLQSPV